MQPRNKARLHAFAVRFSSWLNKIVPSSFSYNKTEHLEDDIESLIRGPFTHFIIETAKDRLASLPNLFRPLFTVEAISGVTYKPQGKQLWYRIGPNLKPALAVYERIGWTRDTAVVIPI